MPPRSQPAEGKETPLRAATTAARKSHRRSTGAGREASSSAARTRSSRTARGRRSNDSELEDVVPPSDDDEYQDWKRTRAGELAAEEQSSVPASSPLAHAGHSFTHRAHQSQLMAAHQREPDKEVVAPITPTHQKATYINLFSPAPPPSTVSTGRTVSPAKSDATTPTLSHLHSTGRNQRNPSPTPTLPFQSRADSDIDNGPMEAWDGEDDELDLLSRRPRQTVLDPRPGPADAGPSTVPDLPRVSSQGVPADTPSPDADPHLDVERLSKSRLLAGYAADIGEITNSHHSLQPLLLNDEDGKTEAVPRNASRSSTPRTLPKLSDNFGESMDVDLQLRSPTPETQPLWRNQYDETMVGIHPEERSPTPETQPVPRNDAGETMSVNPSQPRIESQNLLDSHTPERLDPSPPQRQNACSPVYQDEPSPQLIPTPTPTTQISPHFNPSPATRHTRARLSNSPLSPLTPSPPRQTPTKRNTQASSPAADLTAVFAAVQNHSPVNPTLPPASTLPPEAVIDADLSRFRTARTFRTRTVVQLQPYTKERQIYEAQLRKGRINPHGKEKDAAGTRDKEIRQRREQNEDEAMVSQSSEASISESSEAEGAVGDGFGDDRIVIGPSSEKRARAKTPLSLTNADYAEYLLHHTHAPDLDNMDAETERELQKIARLRVRNERQDAKRKRKEERENKRVERALRDLELQKERERRNKERERLEAEKKKRQEEREAARKVREAKEAAREIVRQERIQKRRDEARQDRDCDEFLNGLRGSSDQDEEENREGRPLSTQERKVDEEVQKMLDNLNKSQDQDEHDRPRRQKNGTEKKATKSRLSKRTPGGTKTYASKARRQHGTDSSDLDRVPQRASPSRPARHTGAAQPATNLTPLTLRSPSPSFRSALSLTGDVGYAQPMYRSVTSTPGEDGGFPQPYTPGGYDLNEDVGWDLPPIMPTPPPRQHAESYAAGELSLDASHQRRNEIIGTMHSPADVLGASDSSESGSGDESDVSSDAIRRDPRRKIAGRMMPAAMLRRLEAEAARKEKDKQDRLRKGREARGRSDTPPLRPGRAVVRRGQGASLQNIDGLFSGDESENEVELRMLGDPEAFSSGDECRPIIVDDDDESSEAVEDNVAEQSLARLQRGDFEGIIAGRRPRASGPTRRLGRRDPQRSKTSRRPALGLAQRRRGAGGGRTRDGRQTRLHFEPIAEEEIPYHEPGNKKRKRQSHPIARDQRPAIRLDDHIIFAPDDFAFDSGDEEDGFQGQSKRSRNFERTRSAASLPAPPEVLDAGIGKARSWANFDRFSVDFDISPLPSGLYCATDSVPGSHRLETLVNILRDPNPTPVVVPRVVREFEIELTRDMAPSEIQEVLDIIFDAIYRQLLSILNNDCTDDIALSPLSFLGLYISARQGDPDEEGYIDGLKIAIEGAIESMTAKLDTVDISQTGSDILAAEPLLRFRWALLELSCRVGAESAKIETDSPLVSECTFALIKQLLLGGFDRTVAPLKSIMRGESESPEITDVSITIWIAVLHCTSAWDICSGRPDGTTFLANLNRAIDTVFHLDHTGPIAAERIWFLVFGLCALSQFNERGEIVQTFSAVPRWALVRRAASFIKVVFDEDAEKRAKRDTLQGRDRYIKAMMARCVRLSAVWKWFFDRESFSVATRDLGVIFKDRQYRNLPTEAPVDYPDFITRFDMTLTAAEDTRHETAFELYIRLVCVAASDIISYAESLTEAQQAERDVQRLVLSIIPVSAVKFNRVFPPSARDLGQLINRYTTMISACYFCPSLLKHLLNNSKKWAPFQLADFESRQICIRGLMYLAVACRHHSQSLAPVVDRLAEILGVLQIELETREKGMALPQSATKLEIERTMVLVVTCFRQMIKHHSFDVEEQSKPMYPDPCLLHECWTNRIFNLDLTKDLKCAHEVVATIQTYLDTRSVALPRVARRRREAKESYQSESMDEYGSLGVDVTAAEVVAALGGENEVQPDYTEQLDLVFIEIVQNVISPKIYRLLSDMLPAITEEEASKRVFDQDRHSFISKLTKCWSDCAAVLVVEHQKLDWDTFISPFGRQSWSRLGDEKGRIQVGLHFMLNVAQLDPGSFDQHSEDFVALFFQSIGTNILTIEHRYISCIVRLPHAVENPLLKSVCDNEAVVRGLGRDKFMENRREILQSLFETVSSLLFSSIIPSSTKSFTYRCINLFVSSLISYDKSINPDKVIVKESYRAFLDTTIADLRRLAGDSVTPLTVPALKYFIK